jgi:hypothetical protein
MNLDRRDGLQPSCQVATYDLAGAVTVCKTVGSAYVGSEPNTCHTKRPAGCGNAARRAVFPGRPWTEAQVKSVGCRREPAKRPDADRWAAAEARRGLTQSRRKSAAVSQRGRWHLFRPRSTSAPTAALPVPAVNGHPGSPPLAGSSATWVPSTPSAPSDDDRPGPGG